MQQQSFDGSYNIGVQAEGDGITVNVGLPYLHLVRRHLRLRPVRRDLDLLNPYSRGVPLVGRRDELARLTAEWLGGGAPVSVRCLIGRAGSGKTRLALELCQAAHDVGWWAGFVEQSEVARFAAQQNLGAWGWPKPTLLVVDDAASARALRKWLAELAEHPAADPERPLRLLLLERHAEPQAGWWRELIGPGRWSEAGIADLLDPAVPVPLNPLADPAERRALLAEVMARASDLANLKPRVGPPAPGESAAFDTKLADPGLEFEPLYLLMAGVTAVRERVPRVLALARTDDLAERLAARELKRIAGLAAGRGLDGDFAMHLAACVTLQGGCARDELDGLIVEEQDALHYRNAGDLPALARLLADALPGEAPDTVSGIRPDLIGEAAVLAALGERPAAQQTAAVRRAYARAPAETVAVLIRTAEDYATATDHPALLWLDDLARTSDGLGTLMVLVDLLPEQTTNLRGRAADLQAAVVDILRSVPEDVRGEEWRDRLAGALNNLGLRLGALGRREEALGAAEEAVALQRELARVRPDTFRPGLAMALHNLANGLSGLGRREEALAAAEEAAGLYRELAARRRDAFRPYLAGSLSNMAKLSTDLGRDEEALAAAEEAVELYRGLAAACPDAFRPYLAGSMINLGRALGALKRPEEALDAVEAAAELYRDLARVRPDAFRPYLAVSMNSMVARLTDLGRWNEALGAAAEAVGLHRELAAAHPDAFRPYLATSVHNLAKVLGNVGRWEEALGAAQEAVALRRELAVAHPDAFRPYLARSLLVLADCLEAMGQLDGALAANTRAITELAPGFLALPTAFVGFMAPIVAGYLRRCERACREPDEELLTPVIEAVERLQKPTSDSDRV